MNRNSLTVLFFCFAQCLCAGKTPIQELTLDEMFTTIAQIPNHEWKDYFPDEEAQKTVFSKAKKFAFTTANKSLYKIFTERLKNLSSLNRSSHHQKAQMLTNIEQYVRTKVAVHIKQELRAMRFMCPHKNQTIPVQLTDMNSLLGFEGKIQELFDIAFSHFSKDIQIAMKMGSHLAESMDMKPFLLLLFPPQEESFRLAIKSALILALNKNVTSISRT